jgi:hypothetical protein
MDGWIVSGGIILLHAGHKTGLMCTTAYLWCQIHLFCARPGFMAETFFCVACIFWLRYSEVTDFCLLFFEYQLIVGLINPNYNSNSRLLSFESVFPSNDLWVSNFIVLLNQKKVRKIQKISVEKTISYPKFELTTSGLAVGSLNY